MNEIVPVVPGPPAESDTNLEYEAEIAHYEGRIQELRAENARLREESLGLQMGEQERVAKWRERTQALQTELKLAQKGLTSGCGCPIGQCMAPKGGEACWMQWAEAHLAGRVANIMKDTLQRNANHPRRNQEARTHGQSSQQATQPALQSSVQPPRAPDSKGLVREPGIEDYGSTSSSSSGRSHERGD